MKQDSAVPGRWSSVPAQQTAELNLVKIDARQIVKYTKDTDPDA
jgi:hypothetical protein